MTNRRPPVWLAYGKGRFPIKPRLLAVALAAVLAVGGCSDSGQPAGADAAATATTTPTGSATPSASAAAPTSAVTTTSSVANPPGGGGGAAPPPPPPAPPQDPNAAFCATFGAAIGRTDQLFGPAVTLDNSSDPAAIEQAWQDIQRIAGEGAALSRQASGQTDNAYLKSVAQALATYFDQVAAAAAARDRAALDSISAPAIPEPPSGMQPPCQA